MSEENLYSLSDETINQIEKQISHAEIDAENSEQFLDTVFPNLSSEDKAKIAMFSIAFVENYGEEDDENEDVDYTE